MFHRVVFLNGVLAMEIKLDFEKILQKLNSLPDKEREAELAKYSKAEIVKIASVFSASIMFARRSVRTIADLI